MNNKDMKAVSDKSIKEKLSEMLQMPKEIICNVPKLVFVGKSDLTIENYKGIIEYDECNIRINTLIGILKISGTKLEIKNITTEEIVIGGNIKMLEYQAY